MPSEPGVTLSPSVVPVIPRTVVSFSASVGMDGIEASSFDSAAKDAFAETTADGIDGVEAQDISNIVAADTGGSIGLQGLSTSSSGVTVSFTITAVEEKIDGDFPDTESLVSSIESDLVEHFDDSDTAESFVELSVSNGSIMPADTEVTFDEPTVDTSTIVETVVSTRSPTASVVVNSNSDGNTDGLDTTGIILVAVGGVLLFVFAAVAYVVYLQKKKPPADDKAQLGVEIGNSSTDNPINRL